MALESVNATQASGLAYARSRYFSEYDAVELEDNYLAWVYQPVRILLQDRETEKYKSIRGAKRGDDLYARKTIDRFQELQKTVKDLDVRTSHKTTQALLVTLTYSKQHESNWEIITQDWQRFTARLRKRYGKIETIRMLEAHKSGLPHLHAIIIFRERRFRTKLIYSKHRDKWIYIMQNERERQAIKKNWVHGFIDIEAIYNLHGAIGYLTKYLTKLLTMELEYSAPHLAKLWIYRKRTFSISQRLDNGQSNSNSKLYQKLLTGEKIMVKEKSYRLIGVVATNIPLEKMEIINIEQVDYDPAVYRITYKDPRKKKKQQPRTIELANIEPQTS